MGLISICEWLRLPLLRDKEKECDYLPKKVLGFSLMMENFTEGKGKGKRKSKEEERETRERKRLKQTAT